VRPTLLSRPPDQVVAEVRRLVDAGHREVVLTGIHLGFYGVDLPQPSDGRVDLAALVRRILSIGGEFRVRLSSLEAAEAGPELLALMAEHAERLCPHFHIPLQSGSNVVLARMRRRWTAEEFLGQCAEIRRQIDEPALTSDVIVGFPGETEADFESTCRVVREARFSRIHVFRYSAREGTEAAGLPDQVPPPVKRRRAEALLAIGRELRLAYAQKLVGKELQVIGETITRDHPGVISGTADRYVTVEFPAGVEMMDRIVRVTADRVLKDGVIRGRATLRGRLPSAPASPSASGESATA
jgi:threonylcarbamoyladenosine tRNA methylthiotransferase MtaB